MLDFDRLHYRVQCMCYPKVNMAVKPSKIGSSHSERDALFHNGRDSRPGRRRLITVRCLLCCWSRCPASLTPGVAVFQALS
jgi:hypothetical protein